MKKIRNYVHLPLLWIGVIIVVGCEDEMPDYYADRVFEVDHFEGVSLGDAFQIEISQEAEYAVIAKGESKDLEDLRLTVVNGVLVGSYRPGSRNHKRTLIQIQTPILQSAYFHSASSSQIYGFTDSTGNLEMKVSGASRVNTTSTWNS